MNNEFEAGYNGNGRQMQLQDHTLMNLHFTWIFKLCVCANHSSVQRLFHLDGFP